MKTKIFSFCFLIEIIIICCSNLYGAWKDTGFIQWKQPNGVTFTARLYGDEFENWMVTQQNYQIIRGSDGYYYYAVLGSNGDFAPSSSKVGINSPLQTSLNLQRSQSRLIEIQNERIAFNQNLSSSNLNKSSGGNSLTSVDLGLAIVLVDFTPNLRDTNEHIPGFGYNYQSFYDLFFSNGTYTGTSPDGEAVFGSVKDYYWEQTGNRYNVTGEIINSTNPSYPTKPLWLTLPNSIDYYAANYSKLSILSFLYNQAVSIYPGLANYQYIGFIYGGNMVSSSSNTFWPHSYLINGRNIHIMSEKFGNTFAHIGTHCHELGHSFFSLHDQYTGLIDPFKYDLMSIGSDNGPILNKGQCPAPISAIDKYIEGFYGELNNISLGTTDYSIYYGSANSNKLYKVSIPNSSEYFILECRRRQGFNQYTPSYTYSSELGLYIWHADPNTSLNEDLVEIQYADNNSDIEDNSFPYNAGSQNFTNFSTPNSRKRDATYSNVAINNIQKIGWHPLYCKVDILDETPLIPANFSGTTYNNHPKITWTLNDEPDIAGYEVYRNITGNYTLLATVSASTSYFVDNEVAVGKPVEGIASYKIRAKDNYPNYSGYTNPVSYVYNDYTPHKKGISGEIYEYKLNSNFPNPFNPSTEISYSLAQSAEVTLIVYDILGTQVAELVNETQSKGNYKVIFNSENLATGTYIYRIVASKNGNVVFTDAKQMILLR